MARSMRSACQTTAAAIRTLAKRNRTSPENPSRSQPTAAQAPATIVVRTTSLKKFSATAPRTALRLVVAQPARRPVVVPRLGAAARAVQGRDVLERHEDVPVEL